MEQIKDNLWKLNDNHYLKQFKNGTYDIIAPIKDPITNKVNWFNTLTGGSWFNLVKIIFIIGIILLITFGYLKETKDCLELRNNIAEGKIVCYDFENNPNKYVLKNWGEKLNGIGNKTDMVLSSEDYEEVFNK